MMGGYLVYLNGKLIGDICDNELYLKRTPTSDTLLADSELRYPYEGSKTLMRVFDRFEDTELALKLPDGMYAKLPEKRSAVSNTKLSRSICFMKLTEPAAEYCRQIREYRQEFLDSGDSMDGTDGLRRMEDPEEWAAYCHRAKDPDNIPEGRVPATQYVFVEGRGRQDSRDASDPALSERFP